MASISYGWINGRAIYKVLAYARSHWLLRITCKMEMIKHISQTKEETGYTSKDVDGVEGRAGIKN